MKLASDEYGTSGPPILILHGLLGHAGNWTSIARRLAEHRRVWCLDQRNHGRSPHSAAMTYADMAGDVCEFIEDHRLDSVVLLGHSMGGKTAMQVAADCPCLVSRLIVVDIAPRGYALRHRRAIEGMQAVNPAHHDSRGEVDRALATHIPIDALRRFLLKNLRTGPDNRLRWMVNVEGIAAAYDTIMGPIPASPGFDGPALFVKGERSDYVSDADAHALRQAYPTSDFRTIPDAGHWLHVQAPDAFLDAVRDFLRSHPV